MKKIIFIIFSISLLTNINNTNGTKLFHNPNKSLTPIPQNQLFNNQNEIIKLNKQKKNSKSINSFPEKNKFKIFYNQNKYKNNKNKNNQIQQPQFRKNK